MDSTQGPSGPTPPYQPQRGNNWQQPIHHSIESPENQFSAPAQNGAGGPMFPHGSSQGGPFDNHSPAQAQRAGAQNQSTAAAASQGIAARNAHTPTPSGAPLAGLNGAAAQQAQNNMEKRGPVEFNHAISYVNKIKVSIHALYLIIY